jgi:hypothetical protein
VPVLTTDGLLLAVAVAIALVSAATRAADRGSSGAAGVMPAFQGLVGAKKPLPGTGAGATDGGAGAATGAGAEALPGLRAVQWRR